VRVVFNLIKRTSNGLLAGGLALLGLLVPLGLDDLEGGTGDGTGDVLVDVPPLAASDGGPKVLLVGPAIHGSPSNLSGTLPLVEKRLGLLVEEDEDL